MALDRPLSAISAPSFSAAASEPILLTGASGFIGSAVANALIDEGRRVRIIVRAGANRRNLRSDCEIVEGDIRDPESVARAMRGVRYVFHLAADYRLWARRPRDIYDNNVLMARNVFDAVLRLGIERLVHTSSVAALDCRNQTPACEDDRLPLEAATGPYKRSKIAIERMIDDLTAREKLPCVVVSPSTPIGPRDVRPTPTGRIILESARGNIPAFVETGLNLVHVDDVAAGHIAAFHKGEIGARYILGGENVAFSQLLGVVAGFVGRRAPKLRLPHRLLYPVACAAELSALITNKEPLATLEGLRLSRTKMYFNDSRAREKLGYVSRPYREGVRDALDWFASVGYLER